MFELRVDKMVCLGVRDDSDASVSDAMQTVFGLEDRAVLVWNGTVFELGFKNDLSMMIDDVMSMLLLIAADDAGVFRVEWASSTFPYEWLVAWDRQELNIVARGRSEPGAKDLAGRESVRLEKMRFVEAWRSVLLPVLRCLQVSGYSPSQIRDLVRLGSAATGS